jgi:hypothetical protein
MKIRIEMHLAVECREMCLSLFGPDQLYGTFVVTLWQQVIFGVCDSRHTDQKTSTIKLKYNFATYAPQVLLPT